MIPEHKQSAVKKALKTAFDTDRFDDIQQLTKGLSSALIFKIMVHEKLYLLRVITRTDAMADPAFYFNCMKIAEPAALGPRIYYLNSEDRISITDFIQEKPFSLSEAREKMPLLLQQLHALPKFPFRINYFDAMENFVAKFRSSNIVPASVTTDLFEEHERAINAYPCNDTAHWISCHNDLKPENVLFDGQKPWLVDWEGAFLNDRYLDLTVVANFITNNENEEADFLKRYFGEAVDEYKLARFFVMRQLLHVYYFIFFMQVGAEGKPVDTSALGGIDFREFNNDVWNGKIDLANNNAKLQYAWVHMQECLRRMHTKRFNDSLHILARHKN
jgi:thiamine kinase-like enzyme